MGKSAAVEQGGLCTMKRCPHSLTASRASLQGRTAGGSGCEAGGIEWRTDMQMEVNKPQQLI